MLSKAYHEGLTAHSYNENPYGKSCQEHEDFHAGFTQRIRRGYNPPPQFDEILNRPSELKGSRLVQNINSVNPKYNSYAEAKKK